MVASLRRVSGATTLAVASSAPDLDGREGAQGLAARLLSDASHGHVIVPFWSAHQLTVALLAAEQFCMHEVRERFEVVVDDSLGGEIMRRTGERFGLRLRQIHTRGNPRRFEDVGAWLRNPGPFFIAVDGGGPYGSVPTGIVRLAVRLDSTVRPLAVRARPALRCPGLVAEMPLPGATLAVGVSAPLRFDRSIAVALAAQELQQRLNAASASAAALLSERDFDRVGGAPIVRRHSA